jgi:hypothetical protein
MLKRLSPNDWKILPVVVAKQGQAMSLAQSDALHELGLSRN